ncbi:MAG: hypothetical protein FWE12_04285 [Oscillospiraceae bacterium]|nr:hypothetical protein [Oscillospiraceae bacterium]
MSKRKSDKTNIQAQIQTQNTDTGLPAFNTDDTRHYERKNMPKGAFKKNQGSK